MFENISQRLSKVVKTLRGEARLTEDNINEALREVRMALLEADVALPVVKDFIAATRERAIGQEVLQSLTPGQALVGVVHDELLKVMGGAHASLSLNVAPPAIILMAGLQGTGKTTTTAKLARYLRLELRKRVAVVSCDVYRPAAIEQLRVLAEQVEVDWIASDTTQDVLAIAQAARQQAQLKLYDVLIVDTAGRLAVDDAMMKEIAALHHCLQPVETLFVVDAMQGQDAVNTAKAFRDVLPLTGVILTKLDGDSRGGAALSVRHITGCPIKFVGVSEKPDGLDPFHPERMASRILGMGDILSLVDAARTQVDEEHALEFAKKLRTGKGFDLNDFRQQMAQMKKMGDLSALIDKLPTELAMMARSAPDMTLQVRKMTGIIDSMTPLERSKPDLIKASRKRRIAAGSGTSVQEVNRLLTQFEQTQKVMKSFAKGGMAKMMRGLKSGLGQFM